MATKSDFAQKLLNDLRLRKERLAASHSSNQQNSYAGARGCTDAYRSPEQTYNGSRQIKALESNGPNTVSRRTELSGGRRSVGTKESSQHIVSYGRTRSSEYIGDLSMAFAFALQNGGNLGKNTNTVIDFLHQIGGKSLHMGKMERRSSSAGHFSNPSNVHIKEVSKGVQNLHHILKTCSNGISFDKYSIEIGKELLKGAMGLEESLRMLVELQEASEYMITTPQRKNKNKIKLLEEEEEEDGEKGVIEQKQLTLPRFSFDNRSKNVKEPAKQRLMALTYTTTPDLVPQRTSPDATLSDMKNDSSSLGSKSEKGRISNVIAKLMGLEELPGKLDSHASQSESSSKTKEGMPTKISTKSVESSTRETENQKQTNKMTPTRDPSVWMKAEKHTPNNVQHRKDFYTRDGVPRKQSNLNQPSYVPENRKRGQDKERRQNSSKNKEQKSTEKNEIEERVGKDESQQKQRSPEVVGALQQKSESKKIKLQNQLSKSDDHENEKMPKKSTDEKINRQGSHKRKHARLNVSSKEMQEEITSQKNSVNGIQDTPSKKNAEVMPVIQKHDEGTFTVNQSSIKNSKLETEKEKHVHLPLLQKKIDSVALHRHEPPRKIDDVLTRRNGHLNNIMRKPRHKLSVMQEPTRGRQEKHSNSNKGAGELRSAGSKVEPSIESRTKPVQNVDVCQSPRIEYPLPEDDVPRMIQDMFPEVQTTSTDHKGQESDYREDIEITCQEASESRPTSGNEGSKDVCHALHQEHKRTFYYETRVVLTETEKQLKEVLVKEHQFLNTAEALFKLNIPVGILHADDHSYNHHGVETRLKLDCAYEIMRRKARSQELDMHPYVKMTSVSYTTINHLDDLIKQLYKCLESLKFYGQDELDGGDYLHKMLERDIYNQEPDINSFWDFGWNGPAFGFVEKCDFVRDVEQFLLQGFVDEITEDLLTISIV